MSSSALTKFSDRQWLNDNKFQALSDIACNLNVNEDNGRECLIRALEHQDIFKEYAPILASLIQKAGLLPYLHSNYEVLSTSELLNYEVHAPEGLDDVILHSMQGKVYMALMDGANVILSAPTSFGKSLLIDAVIASKRYECIVVIVPTIALIDETRRRLSGRFRSEYKIITHPSQLSDEKNIYVFTQERFVENVESLRPDFFVIDEFYKLSPNRGDERTFVLNQAFYELVKSGSQFFLIGPNVRDITIDQSHLEFRYFDTNYSTVAAEVRHFRVPMKEVNENVLQLCRDIEGPTLIYCKSSNSAYKLAYFLRENGIKAGNQEAQDFSQWLCENYHHDWLLADILKDGFAVHHGALPRSVAYHILRKFNEGEIQFLFCTSTIIEGVNTVAKNIIIYDNKIATRKFDLFTFNNIKGRAGRMFEHFVGHVYAFNYDSQTELPFVDVPSFTQPEDAPESLLIQIEDRDLSEHSLKKLRYLHAQEYLPIEILKNNAGIAPLNQISLAETITNDMAKYHPLLSWSGFPNSNQLYAICDLIFSYLMGKKGRDGIFSGRQLWYKMQTFGIIKDIPKLIEDELANNGRVTNASEAVENVLTFVRKWGEYHFPRYLSALDKIQNHVFSQAKRRPGNYDVYCALVKRLFMPLSATVLEEYGIPYQLSQKIEESDPLGDEVDTILSNLALIDMESLELSDFEQDMLKDAIENL